jgi:hypothetical protein
VNEHNFARQNSLFRFTEVPKVSDKNNDVAPPSLNKREEDNCLVRKKAHAAIFAFRGTAIYYGSLNNIGRERHTYTIIVAD